MKNKKSPLISVIGLGYVGLPLALEFSKKYKVVGFDLDKSRIKELKNGNDRTSEISKETLLDLKDLILSYDIQDVEKSDIYIITVPTPVDKNNSPDLKPIKSASLSISPFINKGNIIIYESTVFPGCTEEVCVPILEKKSKLKYNKDFFCGYSPERINPGDKINTLKKIVKITSGSNPEVADYIDHLYKTIITAGTYKAPSIAIAEAAKVIENTQRDVNIALVNELSIIFDKLNLDTIEVLKAAETKWNFMPFRPGLVGGHCIGVDPYYLTFKATEMGHYPEVILSGRKINDGMGNFIADKVIFELAKKNINPNGAKVAILGLTFKENCPDLRNTKVVSIINRLKSFECEIIVSDEHANLAEAKKEYNLEIEELDKIENKDVLIIAVGHNEYKGLNKNRLLEMLNGNGILIDVKSVFDKQLFNNTKITYWKL